MAMHPRTQPSMSFPPGSTVYPEGVNFTVCSKISTQVGLVFIDHIKFINTLAGAIKGDLALCRRLRVLFAPDCRVWLAERLILASEVPEQISTAGYEAGGASNMTFMMNGVLTIASSRGWYNLQWHCENEVAMSRGASIPFARRC